MIAANDGSVNAAAFSQDQTTPYTTAMQGKVRARMLWMAGWVVLALAAPAAAYGAPAKDDPRVLAAAERLFADSVTIRRNGSHNQLLRALRHLRDPGLQPFFEALTEAEHPALRIHGILGLAEISQPAGLDLKRVAELESDAARAELLSAALDDNLIADEDARTLLAWDDLDPGVKLLIAAKMLGEKKFDQADVLQEAMQSNSLARRSMASLLLLESGDAAGLEGLKALDRSSDRTRDAVRVMLLETAVQRKLRSIRPWAYALASDDTTTEPDLAALAMRVAMRFGDKRAVDLWRQQFLDTEDYVQRIRTALVGLRYSPWMAPEAFDTITASEDAFIKQVGLTGTAVAAGDKNAIVQIMKLLETHHPAAARWALSYARHFAPTEESHQIMLGLVLIDEQGPARGRETRLANAAEATRILANDDAEVARNLMRPIVAGRQTDHRLAQAILLGLIRSRPTDAGSVVTGLPDFADPTTNQLALILRLRAREKLNPTQQQDAAILVRGGGELQDPLRIQTAWMLLQQSGQADTLLARVLTALRS